MLKRIGVAQLREGMFIQEFCGSWINHPFWSKSFILKGAKDLNKIRDSEITELWIDTSKGLDVLEPEAQSAAIIVEKAPDEPPPGMGSAEPPDTSPTSMGEELERARAICSRAKTAVTSMFQEARMGKAIDFEEAAPLVEEISASVTRNATAIISLARLKEKDDYTYLHSVAVCALMVALGRQMGLEGDDLRQAGMGGLLHDLGKAAIPLDILNKPGKLTDEEFAIVKGHPAAGHRMLVESSKASGREFPEAPLDICLHHHEKTDGSGYPNGLTGDRISLLARMGAVCDVYDAITSNRPYKAGWDPAESLKRMAEWSKGHFDEKVFHAFVKSVGIYPVGSLVRLASGRLGVVAEQGQGSLLTPLVRAFYIVNDRRFIEPETVDISKPGDRILSRESLQEWNLGDISRYWAQPDKTTA